MISDKIKQNIDTTDYSPTPAFSGKTMNIEIAGGCNERCIYCEYSAQGLHKVNKLIDDELFYRVTKEAKELGITDIGLYITGEPFMNPKLFEYVHYLKNQLVFQYVYISTNGIACRPENLEKLASAGIDSIKFSVSSADSENFKRHHGINAFNRVYENIKYAYEYRKANNLSYKLYMFSILTKYNLHEKECMEKTYGPYLDELAFVNVLSNPYVKGIKEYLEISEKPSDSVNEISNLKMPCIELFDRIVVNENGYLCACCHETRNRYTEIEDLKECSLKDAVYGEKMQQIRKRHLNKDISGIICENCIYGINKDVLPLDIEISNKVKKLKTVDISDEIKNRFCITNN